MNDLLTASRILAGLAFLFTLAGLGWEAVKVMRRPQKADLSRPRGNKFSGVTYAFTIGMMPWAKEATRRHPADYLRGVFLHSGIFASFFTLALLPSEDAWPSLARLIVGTLTAAGMLAGVWGLGHRAVSKNLSALSNPDDYASMILVDAFILGAVLSLLGPGTLSAAAGAYFNLVAVILFIYLPFSKIRHCLYFFVVRYLFGAHFGHRGVIGRHGSSGVKSA